MKLHTFLVEIGTEELPPKALRSIAQAFAANCGAELADASIPHGDILWFAAPRRIALKVVSLSGSQDDSYLERLGPAINKAFDADGNTTKAAEGWASNCGITLDQADRRITDNGEWLVQRVLVKGQPVQKLLCNIVNNAIRSLPKISHMMRWGNKNIRFIRPVHVVSMLLDDELISGSVLGVDSDRILYGHRFMGDRTITLDHADHYPQVLLERGWVMVEYELRKETIRSATEAAALQIGGIADITESLLEEITSLVEWPVVLTARFASKFLAMPTAALVYTMKFDHKYFPVYDAEGQLLPYFIFVANIVSRDKQQIIAGNEKVLHTRFADAEVFFNHDRQHQLVDNLPLLDSMLFHKQLGTLRDKSTRLESLAGWIAGKINANVEQAARAGLLSKCDLISKMVFEFPATQGYIGMHYASSDGEPEAVALAQKEQYQPRFASDQLPTTMVGCALAIADKIDTITGMFGIHSRKARQKAQDPFALRRAALGLLRITVEQQLPLDLHPLITEVVRLYNYQLTNPYVVDDVINFILGRFRTWYHHDKGYSVDIIQAVLAIRPTIPADFDARVRALSNFRTRNPTKMAALAAANKRVTNLLTKVDLDILVNAEVQNGLLIEQAEIQLATSISIYRRRHQQQLLTYEGYQEALLDLATMHKLVDAFLDCVLVLAEQPKVRINRLLLLYQLRKLFRHVADISSLSK